MAEPLLQRCLLLSAMAFTTVGIWRVGVAPADTPPPQAIHSGQLQQLQAQGWQVSQPLPARQGRQLSSAPGYRLIRPTPAGVQLSLIPVRTRSDDDLGSDTIETLLSGYKPTRTKLLTIDGQQFRRFVHTTKLKQEQVASTCIVGGKARAEAVGVFLELARSPKTLAQRVNNLVGGEPLNAWTCTFTRIAVPNGPDADQQIRAVWSSVSAVLTGTGPARASLVCQPGTRPASSCRAVDQSELRRARSSV